MLVDIAPSVLAVLILAAQGDLAAGQNVEPRDVFTGIVGDRHLAVDIAFIIEQADDHRSHTMSTAVLDEGFFLGPRGVLQAGHSESNLVGDPLAAALIGEVSEVGEGLFEGKPHHLFVDLGIEGVEADVEVVDAQIEDAVDLLWGQGVAIGVKAQLGIRQLGANILHALGDLGVDKRLALEERLNGREGKLLTVGDDLFKELIAHVDSPPRQRVVGAKGTFGVAMIGGFNAHEARDFALRRRHLEQHRGSILSWVRQATHCDRHASNGAPEMQ